MADTGYPFSHRLRVRWAETDPQGIVFNGNYLTYFDVAVTEYWRAVGLPYPAGIEDTGADLFTVRTLVNYHAPAHYDDELDIGVRTARIGTSSISMEIGISRGADLLVTGEVIYVTADPRARKSVPVPEKLRAAIAGFEHRAASDVPHAGR